MVLGKSFMTSTSMKSFFVGAVVLMAVAAFIFTSGIGPMYGRLGMDNMVAARVAGNDISMRALQKVVDQYDRQSGQRPEPSRRKANLQSGLNQLIEEQVVVEEARRYGWEATDLEVAQWIRRLELFQDPKTKKFDRALYDKFIASGQFSELEVFSMGRTAVIQQKIGALYQVPLYRPLKLTEEEFKRNSIEFFLEYAEFAPQPQQVTQAIQQEAQKYLQKPENLNTLREKFEKTKSTFVRPAQVKVQTLLVAHKGAERVVGEAEKRSEEEAQKIANSVLSRLKSGQPFAKVSAEINDDPAAQRQNGDLGWVDESQLDAATAKVAFQLGAQNPISSVIKTPFGYRVVKWLEARSKLEKTFEDAKQELAIAEIETAVKNKMVSEMENSFRTVLAKKDLAATAAALNQYNLSWKALKSPLTATDRFIAELGLADAVLPYIFSLKNPGDFAPEVFDFTGRRVLLRLIRRSAPNSADKKALQAAQQRSFGMEARNFMVTSQSKLVDKYSRDKEIQRNKSLLE